MEETKGLASSCPVPWWTAVWDSSSGKKAWAGQG